MPAFEAVSGAKMTYLIRRRAGTSRDELVAHWFKNHMPHVIRGQLERKAAGRSHARRYLVTLFDPEAGDPGRWDGMAQLWWERPLPRPDEPFGTVPTDTFQQKAEPYLPWATTEYVVLDGALPVEPLTLDDPFPCTRSGLHKVTSLVRARPGADFAALFDHWLDVHAPNVRDTMQAAGGFRYCVSLSVTPEAEPLVGMAELYFREAEGVGEFFRSIRPDGLERWVETSVILGAGTEMIGLP